MTKTPLPVRTLQPLICALYCGTCLQLIRAHHQLLKQTLLCCCSECTHNGTTNLFQPEAEVPPSNYSACHLPPTTYPPPTAHPVLQFCRILWSPCLILPCCFVAWCALRGWNTWPHAVQGTSLCCCCWLLLLLPVVVLVGCHDDAQKERIEQGQKQGKANLLPQLSLFFLSR